MTTPRRSPTSNLGSITQLSNGKYWARTHINGKVVSLGCHTLYKDAQLACREAATARRSRGLFPDGYVTKSTKMFERRPSKPLDKVVEECQTVLQDGQYNHASGGTGEDLPIGNSARSADIGE